MDKTQTVELWTGYTAFCSSIVLFGVINIILTTTGNPRSVSSKTDPWKWRNLFISWVHAVIVGTWDILCLVLYPECLDDLVDFNNNFIYMMVAFSTGYFVYDSLDMLMNKKLLKYWEVSLHHIFVIWTFWTFWYNFHNKTCIGYCVLALMAEISSILLHLRKLLQMCQISFDSTLYKTVIYSNLLTFIPCRIPPIGLIFYGIYKESHRLPPIFFPSLPITVFGMLVINLVLLFRLFTTDVLKTYRKVLETKTETVSEVNGNNITPRSQQTKTD